MPEESGEHTPFNPGNGNVVYADVFNQAMKRQADKIESMGERLGERLASLETMAHQEALSRETKARSEGKAEAKFDALQKSVDGMVEKFVTKAEFTPVRDKLDDISKVMIGVIIVVAGTLVIAFLRSVGGLTK